MSNNDTYVAALPKPQSDNFCSQVSRRTYDAFQTQLPLNRIVLKAIIEELKTWQYVLGTARNDSEKVEAEREINALN